MSGSSDPSLPSADVKGGGSNAIAGISVALGTVALFVFIVAHAARAERQSRNFVQEEELVELGDDDDSGLMQRPPGL